MTTEEVEEKIDFLIKLLQLPSITRFVKNLSGGQQRRMSLAAALIHGINLIFSSNSRFYIQIRMNLISNHLFVEPELLILDEPTVGVDPVLRNNIWDHLVHLTSTGKKTVIITTHYIEETRQAHVVNLK